MKRSAIAFSVLMLSVAAAAAADDPIATRKTLMDANGAAAAVSAALLKGDLDYNPTVAKAAIMTLRAVSHSYGAFFPAGSDKGNTKASPKIWEDAAGFQKELAEFQEHADAAAQAAGKNGPADLAAFKAAVTPIFDDCKDCHQNYRLK
jgi:cytochrome c556